MASQPTALGSREGGGALTQKRRRATCRVSRRYLDQEATGCSKGELDGGVGPVQPFRNKTNPASEGDATHKRVEGSRRLPRRPPAPRRRGGKELPIMIGTEGGRNESMRARTVLVPISQKKGAEDEKRGQLAEKPH